MKTVHNYELEEEAWEEQKAAGRYNPATMLIYRDRYGKHRVALDSGESDDIYVFREGEATIVLSMNYSYGYAGVQVFEKGEEIDSLFTQNAYEDIGRDWDERSPMTIAKRMWSRGF